jgi:antitoxin component of RelBE/YafQ-DinJ toxin-antitoxin module
MRYDKDKNDVLNIRLSISLKEQYLRFIKDNGYSLSRRIRILLENDMKNGK